MSIFRFLSRKIGWTPLPNVILIPQNKVQVSTSEEIVYIIDDNSDEEIEIVKKENQPNNKHEILKNINKENFSECRPSSTEV